MKTTGTELLEAASGELPPVLMGRLTPEVRQRVDGFYASVAHIFDSWVSRCKSLHTRRAYREDVMSFVRFMGWNWPVDSMHLLRCSIQDVQAFRDHLVSIGAAPKTLNRRISSLSSFFKYLAGAAAELRLPITVPNPAHAQFLGRASRDSREERQALSATRARQLMAMPSGDTVFAARDRAILKFFLYTGARLGTACRLTVSDFQQDCEAATIRLHEKGDKWRTIGLHFAAAEAISEYLQLSGIETGPLFRPRQNAQSEVLADRPMDEVTMWRTIRSYLERLPGSRREIELPDGSKRSVGSYTPHSLRATTATLLLDAGVDIRKVQELLGHRHITTTQIYDRRRRATSDGASHDVPI